MKQYLDILQQTLNGEPKKPYRNREGQEVSDTVGIFAAIFRHKMSDGFPLVTTKKVPLRLVAVELEAFLKGITDKKWFQDRNCHIWDDWCNPQVIPENISKEERIFFMKENRDLGPLGYSHGWRNFGGDYIPIPQIPIIISKLPKLENNDDTKNLVGNKIVGKYGEYLIYRYDGKNKYNTKLYSIVFTKTGYFKNNIQYNEVIKGNIFDPYYPSILGVACLGNYKESNLNKKIVGKLKNSWKQMIHRCYNIEHKSYQNYGSKGIYVDNRWLVFSNYLNDVQSISGWESKVNNWNIYSLDKDILGKRCYSKDTTIWVNRIENNNHTSQNYYFDAISPDGINYNNNLGLSRFCKQHNLKVKTVEASIRSNTNTSNGWKFTRKENFSNTKSNGIDQFKLIVQQLEKNPYDRRMVCSAWDIKNLNGMGLPPCHTAWNVVVYNGKLNLIWNQRSCDAVLGIPFNIASYALLLKLLAKHARLEEGELVGTLHDCHIYTNQIEGVKEQLSRTPFSIPQVKIPDNCEKGFDIFQWDHTQIELLNYQHHPHIKYKLEV